MFQFYKPWKHQKTSFSDVFRGDRSETMVENGLIKLTPTSINNVVKPRRNKLIDDVILQNSLLF